MPPDNEHDLGGYEQAGLDRTHLEPGRRSRSRGGVGASCRAVCSIIVPPAVSVGGPWGGYCACRRGRPGCLGHRMLGCAQDTIGTREPWSRVGLSGLQRGRLCHARLRGSRIGERGAPSVGRRSPARGPCCRLVGRTAWSASVSIVTWRRESGAQPPRRVLRAVRGSRRRGCCVPSRQDGQADVSGSMHNDS